MKNLSLTVVGAVLLASTLGGCGLFAGPPHKNEPAMVLPSPSHSSAKWMTVNSHSKTVDLKVIAGYANQGFNLNGTANGAMRFSVPEGWHVDIQFRNEAGLANSLAVVPLNGSHHIEMPGAETPNPSVGIKQGTFTTLSFTASKPGRFRLASIVAGHETSGMWAAFTVTSSGTPSLRL